MYIFRVHWYCKRCDKPAVQAVRTYSQMSNPIRENIVSTINQVATDSLNKVADNMAKAIENIQRVLTSQCKFLEEKVSNLVGNTTMDTSDTGKSSVPSGVDSHAVKHETSDVFGVLKELEDRNRRKSNFLIYNLPEPTGSNRAGIDSKTVESIIQKRFCQSLVQG